MINLADYRATDERTRYHEAGHAVVGVQHGFHLVGISTERTKGSPQACAWHMPSPRDVLTPLRPRPSGECRLVGACIATILAGEEAATLHLGRRMPWSAREDDAAARHFAHKLGATEARAPSARWIDRYLTHARARVVAYLRQPAVWTTVEALAEMLSQTRNLTADEVQQFFAGQSAHLSPRYCEDLDDPPGGWRIRCA